MKCQNHNTTTKLTKTTIRTENIKDELEIFIKASISMIPKQHCVEKSSKLPSVNVS